MSTSAPISPRTVVENIWKEVLGLPSIDADLTFMDLGGTSLLANMLVAKLGKSLGVSIPVIKVFEYPTLRHFTKFMATGEHQVTPAAPVVAVDEAAVAPAAVEISEISDNDVAIIGMACRFPGANNVDEFWKNLVDGKDSVAMLSMEELSPEVPAELKNDPRYIRARGMIENPYALDAAFFDISPMEAKLIDPQQRVLLETAWQALENAGHGPGSFEGRTAVFAGIEDNTYYKEEILPFPEAEKRAGRFSIMTGNEKDFVAMRIAHKLNLRGPAISVHTACSTSLVAVIMAAKSLRHGECDMALAGGASVHFPTHDGYYYQEGGVFSPDGRCRPFDKDAQGTTFTDGAGIVVLRRLKDAIRDRNTIYAVIKVGAVNSDGGDKISFSAPSISGQTTCISDALTDAGVDAGTIQFVEAHGTATPMGDPIEVEALRQAFRKHTQKKQFCGLGSVKSNVGHTTTAAGVTSLIKVALALKNKAFPATVHYKSPNPGLDIENSPFYVVNRHTDWKRELTPRRAGVSSFGIGGTNSHLVMEEAPTLPASPAPAVERPFEIFPIATKTVVQRDKLLSDLASLGADARSAAFSLQNGRSRFKTRGARIRFQGITADDIVVQKDKVIEDPCLVFMFPGQGSQYIEMGKSLFEHFPEFQKTFLDCCAVLDRELGLDFKTFIFDAANKETLENTKYTQPALFAIEVSLGKMLIGWGITPDVMVGHSVGEFAAACLSGVFSLEDGLKMISARGRLMASLPRGKMLSVRGPLDAVRKIAGDDIDVASVNSPVHCVLAGEDEKIKVAQEALEKGGLPCRMLHTSHAFHSTMMSPMVEPFHAIASEVKFQAPRFKIVSTVTGKPMTDADATNPMYWANHLRATVHFSQAIFKTIEDGGNLFLEVGPRTTLSSLTLQHLKGEKGTAISILSDNSEPANEIGALATALSKLWIHGLELPWNRIWTGGSRIPVLPFPFEYKNYRFSENRKPEVKTVSVIHEVAELMEEVAEETGAAEEVVETSVADVLMGNLSTIFSDFSGMSFESRDATFVENGFDSLVLMQIGVELGKKYGVSVALRDLMEKLNTLQLLANHIFKTALAKKLPQAVRKQAPARTVFRQQPVLVSKPPIVSSAPLAPMPADVSQVIQQQLTQMKEILELQLRYLAATSKPGGRAVVPAVAPLPEQKAKSTQSLIRAKHQQPPRPDAFRANSPDGSEAWYRFDSQNQHYEILN
ncbi:MAG: acyltransferase domain-containing protein [Deltaproteobacteria bacterium]|nr:acyltransferase domain-containing protein [Deltaproteobacteria bacterium]